MNRIPHLDKKEEVSMHILIVNDDGYQSEPLRMLCRELAARGHQITVAAPYLEQSGKAHSITVSEAIRVDEVEIEGAAAAYAVRGTPVDCTRLGLLMLADKPVDLVVSGPNLGENAGISTYASGTVAGARQAIYEGVPGIALSAEAGTTWETQSFFIQWCCDVVSRYLAHDRPPMSLLNINCPAVPVLDMKPPVFCPLDTSNHWAGYTACVSPRGKRYFFIGVSGDGATPEPGTDLDLLKQGHITCTFIGVHVNDQAQYASLLDF